MKIISAHAPILFKTGPNIYKNKTKKIKNFFIKLIYLLINDLKLIFTLIQNVIKS